MAARNALDTATTWSGISTPSILANMGSPRSGFVHSPPQGAWEPSTERTISSAISSSSTSNQGRNAEEDFEFVESLPSNGHVGNSWWNMYPSLAVTSSGLATEHNNWPLTHQWVVPLRDGAPDWWQHSFDALIQTLHSSHVDTREQTSAMHPYWYSYDPPPWHHIEEADWKTPAGNFDAFRAEIRQFYSWKPDFSAVEALYEGSRLGYPVPPAHGGGWLFFHGHSPQSSGGKFVRDSRGRLQYVPDVGKPRYIPFARKQNPSLLSQCPAYWARRYSEYEDVIANLSCVWPPYPDHPTSYWEETTAVVIKDLDSAPSSQELSPLHLRSNQNRPRLLLFNYLSRLWLPLRQDRFLVLLTYLLGGTTPRDVPRYTLVFIQCRHVPRTVPYV